MVLSSFLIPAAIPLIVVTKRRRIEPDTNNLWNAYGVYILLINISSMLIFGVNGLLAQLLTHTALATIEYVLLSLAIALVYEAVWNKFRGGYSLESVHVAKKTNYHIFHIIGALVLFFSFLLFFSTKWILSTFGNLTAEALIYQINSSIEGVNSDLISSYIQAALLPTLFFLGGILIILFIPIRKEMQKKVFQKYRVILQKKYFVISSMVLLFLSYIYAFNSLHLVNYVSYATTESNFIFDNYVNPQAVDIVFPEERRNLIYIYLESMETTYYSTELGGAMETNLASEISELAQENINFSNTKLLGGAYQTTGTGWTSAGMASQMTGLPLKVESNSYGVQDGFLPGAWNLGDILNEAGYKQALMIGSDSVFGGRRALFTQHGNYSIYDYYTAIEDGIIEADYCVWWGLEDSKLYDYAKKVIIEMSNQDEPFNFTMLTVDTHFPGGYVCSICDDEYDEQFSNVISCASNQVCLFVRWIQAQDFYENTTVVIVGDHLSMDPDYFNDIDKEYLRTTMNVFINSAVPARNTHNRKFSAFDFFPTTLCSMGVAIEGDRLCLGTNLFSSTDTLIEREGLAKVNSELRKKSVFYNSHILYPK